MNIYRYIIKIIWLVAGLFIGLYFYVPPSYLVGVALGGVSVGALSIYSPRYKFVFIAAFGILCAFIPAGVLFLPLVMPEEEKNHLRKLSLLLLLFAVTASFFWAGAILGVIGYMCAVLLGELSQKDVKIKNLQDKLREEAEISRKKELLLLESQADSSYKATLEERTRIARDIHDNMGHSLARSILQAAAMKATRDISGLDDLQTNLQETMESIRKAVHNMKIEGTDIKTKLEEMCAETNLDYNLNFDCGKNMPENIKHSFLLVTKEALVNVLRHSNATKIEVMLQEHPALYQLLIKDNGTKTPARPYIQGIGLSNMDERIRELGGTCSFDSHNGFKIFITVPKERKI